MNEKNLYQPPLQVRGFTLVELLVVITLIVVLAGVGFPAITKMRSNADKTKCTEQLREWGIILAAYAGENEGKVDWNRWESISTKVEDASVYLPYMSSGSVDVTIKDDQGSFNKLFAMRNCPAKKFVKVPGGPNPPVTYAMTRPSPHVSTSIGGGYTYLAKITNPSRFIFMMDSLDSAKGTLNDGGAITTSVKPLTQVGVNLRHSNSKVNALMGDFSVRSMSWKELEKGLAYWSAY